MRKLIARFIREEEGLTAVEYGVMAALIVVVLVAVMTLLGDELYGVFEGIFDEEVDGFEGPGENG